MEEQINAAIDAHSQWFLRLRKAIESGNSEFDPKVVKTDNACVFGKWLYNEISPELKSKYVYEEIKALHASFHRQASVILETALKGEKQKALDLMAMGGEFMKTSGSLVLKMKSLLR